MKKTYQAPTIKVKNLQVDAPILAGSGGLSAGDQKNPSVGSKGSLFDDYEDENNEWDKQ